MGFGGEVCWQFEIGCEVDWMFVETGWKFENAGCGLKIGWKFGKLVRKFEAGFERKFVGMKFEFGCEVQVDWKFGKVGCGLNIG